MYKLKLLHLCICKQSRWVITHLTKIKDVVYNVIVIQGEQIKGWCTLYEKILEYNQNLMVLWY